LQLAITDSNTNNPYTFEMIIENVSDQEEYNEFSSIYNTSLTYLSKLPHQLVDDLDDCYGNLEKFHNRVSYKRFSSLKKLIKDFLNKDLEWEKETVNRTLSTDSVTRKSKGIWKLNNRIFNYSEFSDGEKTLFAYSLLFFLMDQNPKIRIKECIIVIDEPELHLHPESEFAVIKGIRNVINEYGQLWIATHSINILSDLAYDEIFMVKEME
jgi:predicted ATP-dependent endonuclease of OLD family